MRRTIITCMLAWGMALLPALLHAQEKEFEANGYIQMQGGVFVPLTSQLYQDHDSRSFREKPGGDGVDETKPCDPVKNPLAPCMPVDHGAKAGKLSIMRGSIRLVGDWRPEEKVTVHGVISLVGSLKLDVDKYAQPPSFPDGVNRRDYAKDWAWRNYYNEVDLRELYVDIEATKWLTFRLGRQQVVWGDINSYRLLDVINPVNTTWHFGPLESFEDTRIPLWIWKTMFEIKEWDHSLEFVWVSALDRDKEMVNPPLTLVGAWGLPLSNTPSPFIIKEKKFLYPGNEIEDSRIGLRWRGNITPASTYSLMYFYTHVISPPIPMYWDLAENMVDIETLYLGFPRQHIAGAAIDYAFESPIGMVAKLEASVEPDRTYPRISSTPFMHEDPEIENRQVFEPPEKTTVNYAVQLMRPTMIRWLNPTQNFLFVTQWSHTIVPDLSEFERQDLVVVPGFNDYKLQAHSFTGVFAVATNYMHGLLSPKVTAAYIHPKSGFIATQLAVRLGRNWRLRLQVTDFFGADPYKAVGFFRDRDEVNLLVRYQF